MNLDIYADKPAPHARRKSDPATATKATRNPPAKKRVRPITGAEIAGWVRRGRMYNP